MINLCYPFFGHLGIIKLEKVALLFRYNAHFVFIFNCAIYNTYRVYTGLKLLTTTSEVSYESVFIEFKVPVNVEYEFCLFLSIPLFFNFTIFNLLIEFLIELGFGLLLRGCLRHEQLLRPYIIAGNYFLDGISFHRAALCRRNS